MINEDGSDVESETDDEKIPTNKKPVPLMMKVTLILNQTQITNRVLKNRLKII
jgi:hypothetical protein